MRRRPVARHSKKRPYKKVRFGKRSMKWGGAKTGGGGAAVPDNGQFVPMIGGGGGGGGQIVDGFQIPGPIQNDAAAVTAAASSAFPNANAAVSAAMGSQQIPDNAPEIIALEPNRLPIGYRIWNIIFHATILYVEAMSAQGIKIRVTQLCEFVWNILDMTTYAGQPLTVYISRSTTFFVVQLVAGANFAKGIFYDFIGGGVTYLSSKLVEGGGVILGILQPILYPAGVLINLAGRAALNLAPLAPPVALIAWMGITKSAVEDVNWLANTVSNATIIADHRVRQIITAKYAAAIQTLSNPMAFIPSDEEVNAVAVRIPGGLGALRLVRRAANFQITLARSATGLATASAPQATATATTVFVYSRNATMQTYIVLSPLLEKTWGMSSSAIAASVRGLRGFAVRMFQGGLIIAQTVGWALDQVREIFEDSYKKLMRSEDQSDSSASSVSSSVSVIATNARGKIDIYRPISVESQNSAAVAVGLITEIADSVSETENAAPTSDAAAEQMAENAAIGEELISALRAAAMLATPGTPSGSIGQNIVSAAAAAGGGGGGGAVLEASGAVLNTQLENMGNVEILTEESGEAAVEEAEEAGDKTLNVVTSAELESDLKGEEGEVTEEIQSREELAQQQQRQRLQREEEDNSPPAVHQETFFPKKREREREITGDDDLGGRKSRRRRRHHAKHGKRKTLKKRKQKKIVKRR